VQQHEKEKRKDPDAQLREKALKKLCESPNDELQRGLLNRLKSPNDPVVDQANRDAARNRARVGALEAIAAYEKIGKVAPKDVYVTAELTPPPEAKSRT
jgi:hypothetical protein